jgi:DinB superfamily
MSHFGETIVRTGRRTRGYAEKLLAGISPAQFARLPVVGGVTIQTNHPAFLFGHLSLYPTRLAHIAGLEPAPFIVPASWEPLFKAGAPCLDDTHSGHEGATYPPMAELTSTYFQLYDAAFERIENLEDAAFARPNPDERYREFFPTVGTACGALLNNHVAVHMGQISAWRRCMGLASVG